MTQAVLFDLGNTLVAYYRKEEFAPVLQQCVQGLLLQLQKSGMAVPDFDSVYVAALRENREAADHRFAPLWPRLQRILAVDGADDAALTAAFMQPIFATAKVYDDVLPALRRMKERGVKIAIVSNAPWGSAPQLWRSELQRLGLADTVDAIVMCGDVGWRKPAPQIFRHAAERLDVACEDCVFVGDDIEWDINGSAAVGMRPVLLDRARMYTQYPGERIDTLFALRDILNEGDR